MVHHRKKAETNRTQQQGSHATRVRDFPTDMIRPAESDQDSFKISRAGSGRAGRCSNSFYFSFFFPFIPCIILALLLRSLPVGNSDPGSHTWRALLPPPHYGARAYFVFIARIIQPFYSLVEDSRRIITAIVGSGYTVCVYYLLFCLCFFPWGIPPLKSGWSLS